MFVRRVLRGLPTICEEARVHRRYIPRYLHCSSKFCEEAKKEKKKEKVINPSLNKSVMYDDDKWAENYKKMEEESRIAREKYEREQDEEDERERQGHVPPQSRVETALYFAFGAVCVGLAYQQYSKYQVKDQVVRGQENNLREQPADAALVLQRYIASNGKSDLDSVAATLEYRRVACTGRFDYSRQVIVGPRERPGHKGIGYHLVTPFVLSSRKTKPVEVMVNRGWIPQAGLKEGGTIPIHKLKALCHYGPPSFENATAKTVDESEFEFMGVFSRGEEVGQNRNAPEQNEWRFLKVRDISQRMGLASAPAAAPGLTLDFFPLLVEMTTMPRQLAPEIKLDTPLSNEQSLPLSDPRRGVHAADETQAVQASFPMTTRSESADEGASTHKKVWLVPNPMFTDLSKRFSSQTTADTHYLYALTWAVSGGVCLLTGVARKAGVHLMVKKFLRSKNP